MIRQDEKFSGTRRETEPYAEVCGEARGSEDDVEDDDDMGCMAYVNDEASKEKSSIYDSAQGNAGRRNAQYMEDCFMMAMKSCSSSECESRNHNRSITSQDSNNTNTNPRIALLSLSLLTPHTPQPRCKRAN